jgi:hypothetical protein
MSCSPLFITNYDDSKSNQIELNGIKYNRKSMNEQMILQMILENLVNDK